MIASAPTYIPFLSPLPWAYQWWWLSAIPLVFGIAMVYKAYRMPTLAGYWRQVALMTAQVLAAMVLFALTLFFVVLWLVPRIS